MRSHLAPLLLPALLACTGRTAPLDIQDLVEAEADAGRVDSGAATDGGVLIDAGTPFDAGGIAGCGFAGPLSVQLRIDAPPQFPAYSGPALVTNGRPLRLYLLRVDAEVQIAFEGVERLDRLTPGAEVFVEYGTDTPQWTNAAVMFRNTNPRGGPGEPFLAVWRFGELSDVEPVLDIDDLELRYVADACARVDLDGCGPARTQTLRVSAAGYEVDVPAGTQVSSEGLTFGNGRSYRYDPRPECLDTPLYWHEGFAILGR